MKINKMFDSYRKRLLPPYNRKALLFIGAILLIVLIIPLNIFLFSHAGKSAASSKATPAVTVKTKKTVRPTSGATSIVPSPTATQTTSPHQPTPTQTTPTYADYGSQAIKNMLNDFYTNGWWKGCMYGCSAQNTDWGADSLTYTLFLRWKIHHHDPSVVPILQTLAETAPTWQSPCQSIYGCRQPWSDQPLWDSIALGDEYEATGLTNSNILVKEQAAFNVVDGADSSVYLFGACPNIHYQQPGGGANQVKTLETDANYIKAALLLYQNTNNVSYLNKARAAYAAVRHSFLDPNLPLYTVYVFDNGTSCSQAAGRFFASVNGNMIDNGLRLAQYTGDSN